MFLPCVLDGSLLRFLKFFVFDYILLHMLEFFVFGCFLWLLLVFFHASCILLWGVCFCVFGGLRPLIDRADYAAFYCCDILSLFLFDKFCMPLYRAARSFLCRVLREVFIERGSFCFTCHCARARLGARRSIEVGCGAGVAFLFTIKQ